jgi:hypothetical protein
MATASAFSNIGENDEDEIDNTVTPKDLYRNSGKQSQLITEDLRKKV